MPRALTTQPRLHGAGSGFGEPNPPPCAAYNAGMTLGELAQKLGAELNPAPGTDPAHAAQQEILRVSGLEEAEPDALSFVANPRYTQAARSTQAAAVLVEPDFPALPVATLRIRNPYLAFAKAVELFYQSPQYRPGVHPTAVVDPSAALGEGVHIGPYVVIGARCKIGARATILAHAVLYEAAEVGPGCFLHAHSVIRESCVLGSRVTLGNGAVVGSDGFGFAKDERGAWYKIVQSGRVIVGDDVEIQAGSCIDRASIGETRIANGAKIDNLVQVGHGSSVGEHTLLCSQVGLAGSSRIGRNVILAGQVGVAGHCTVGDGAIATAQSGIPNDVAPGETVSGYPAINNRQWLRTSAAVLRLPEILKRIGRLERFLKEAPPSLQQE